MLITVLCSVRNSSKCCFNTKLCWNSNGLESDRVILALRRVWGFVYHSKIIKTNLRDTVALIILAQRTSMAVPQWSWKRAGHAHCTHPLWHPNKLSFSRDEAFKEGTDILTLAGFILWHWIWQKPNIYLLSPELFAHRVFLGAVWNVADFGCNNALLFSAHDHRHLNSEKQN